MIRILITSHGGMAEGMTQLAKMLVGKQKHLDYVTLGEEMGPDELDELYREEITSVSPDNQHLAPCDIKGGMPFNAVPRYSSKNEGVAVICGMNLPILIEAIIQCGNPDIKLKDLTEYLQQQSGPIIGLSELQDRTQETEVRSPNVHNESLHQVRGRLR